MGAKYGMKLEGVVIGDLLFGTYILTAEGGESCTGRLRGEVLTVDAPAVAGWNEVKHRKVVAKWKEKRDGAVEEPKQK